MTSESDSPNALSAANRSALLGIARDAIASGLQGQPWRPGTPSSEALRAVRASFVTLRIAGNLRGCIGTLVARAPLDEEVAAMARAAAFDDPRFPAVTEAELAELQISISVLTAPQPISFQSEDDLLAQLRPGVDGLIMRDGGRSGTFLPSVWDSLPQPREFLAQLRLKAGLPRGHWSQTLEVDRYTAEVFRE